jgi:Phosphotransferase enzyme family
MKGVYPQLVGHVSEMIESTNFYSLRARGLEVHRQATSEGQEVQHSPRTECTINTSQFASGMANLVFEIGFSDGIILIARIWTNHTGLFTATDSETKSSLETEIQTMQYVADHSTIPVPTVLDFNLEPDNPVGKPYMIMTALGGRPLGCHWSEIPSTYREETLDQLASYIIQLRKMEFPSIGSLRYDGDAATIMSFPEGDGPYLSSVHYVYATRIGLNPSIRRDDRFKYTEEDKDMACWVLLQAALGTLHSSSVVGPFPISHPGLHRNNILVDTDYNITGIIDWHGASTVPQEVFAAIPGFRPAPLQKDGLEKVNDCRRMFVKSLEKYEATMESVEGNLRPSRLVGSDEGHFLRFGLDRSPWRAAGLAQSLVEHGLIFGKETTWEKLRDLLKDMHLFKN